MQAFFWRSKLILLFGSWNKTSQDFKDAWMKENAFEEILANLTISFSNTDLVQKLLSSIEEARKIWRNIKALKLVGSI